MIPFSLAPTRAITIGLDNVLTGYSHSAQSSYVHHCLAVPGHSQQRARHANYKRGLADFASKN